MTIFSGVTISGRVVASLPPPQLTIIGQSTQTTANGDITVPAHLPGDYIVLFRRSGTSSQPSIMPGWTSQCGLSGNGGNNSVQLAFDVSTITDTNNTINTISASGINGYQMGCVVFRAAQNGAGNLDFYGGFFSPANSPGVLPSLNLAGTGPSIVLGGIISQSTINWGLDPSGMTRILDNKTPSVGNGTWGMFASNSILTSFTGANISWESQSTYYVTWAIGVRPV